MNWVSELMNWTNKWMNWMNEFNELNKWMYEMNECNEWINSVILEPMIWRWLDYPVIIRLGKWF